MSESDTDSDDIAQLREELPDDRTERLVELNRRSKNRDLTEAEGRVVAEDGEEILEEMQPVMVDKLIHRVAEMTSDLLDMFGRRNGDE